MASLKLLSVDPPLVVVSTETARYLFGAPEGTQRIAVEHKVRLLKLNAVCLLKLSDPNDFMGLPGMLLTLNDMQKKSLTLIGPRGTQDMLSLLQSFLKRTLFPIKTLESAADSPQRAVFPDMAIACVSVAPKLTCYICSLPNITGRFDVDKAAALSIPKGPLFAALKRGEVVTLESGRVVMPAEVVGADELGAHFIIVGALEAGDEQCLAVLLLHREFAPYLEGGALYGRLCLALHLSPAQVVRSSLYAQWMQGFGSACQHIVLGADHSSSIPASPFVAANRFNYKLNAVVPELCPRIIDLSSPPSVSQSLDDVNIRCGQTLMSFVLAPLRKRALCGPETVADDRAEFSVSIEANVEFRDAMSQVIRSAVSSGGTASEAADRLLATEVGDLVFLGTGSAIPCKYRNVSGILVRRTGGAFLLDAGEGSLSQMSALGVDVRSLRMAWVSHPHADHHLGLVRVIAERRRLDPQAAPLLVVAPPSVLTFLDGFSDFHPAISGAYVAVSCRCFDDNVNDAVESTVNEGIAYAAAVLQSLGIGSLRSCRVDHCSEAYGVLIESYSGVKLVYSGDTRPSERLVRMGQGATVLIHEATFGDDKQAEAIDKKHSTVGEALDVGSRMNAHRVVLTHYSQRYPSFPPIHKLVQSRVLPAFDSMVVSFASLVWAQQLTPALLIAFPPEEEDEDEEVSSALDSVALKRRSEPGAFATQGFCRTENKRLKRNKAEESLPQFIVEGL